MKSRWLYAHALPAGIALLFFLPLLWLFFNSLGPLGIPEMGKLVLIPSDPQWSNYVRVFTEYPLTRQFFNSIVLVALAVPLTLITASLGGFAMAQLPNPIRNRLVLGTIVLLIIPLPALWMPRFVILSAVGLTDTLFALLIPALMGSSPFFVLLFYWTFRRIPLDLYDSARIDGASRVRIWWAIALPLARPTLAVTAVLAFVMYWSDYLTPLVYLRTDTNFTFSQRLQMFTQQDIAMQPLAMAAVVVSIVPSLVLFLMVQRYFWPEGRTGGFAGR
jgi:multiple sugar transport system permease protein